MRNRFRNYFCVALSLFLLAQAPAPEDSASADSASSAAAAADAGADALRDIIGVGWDELRECATNTDCVLIYDFVGCCNERPVNMKYAQLIEQNRDQLHEKLTPPKDIVPCLTSKCIPPRRRVACIKDMCQAAQAPRHLEKVDVLLIANEFLARQHSIQDFDLPVFAFDNDKMIWLVDYGAKKRSHKKNMEEQGHDTGYIVMVNDGTRQTELKAYELKQ